MTWARLDRGQGPDAAVVDTLEAGRRVPGGVLVSLDGPGGVGKTTLTRLLADALTDRGLAAHATTEPSSTPLGQLARQGPDHLGGLALACLVAADRYQHLQVEIQPALAAGARRPS